MAAAYFQVHLRLNFSMEANTMNLDQTLPSFDFGFILVAMWAALEKKQMGEQTSKVVIVGEMVQWCYYICIEIFVCC